MTLNIDWDTSLWLYVPSEFPWQGYPDLDAWVGALTEAYRHGGIDDGDAAWIGDYVRGLSANNTSGAHRFAWFGDPLSVLLSVDVLEQPHDSSRSLHDLVGSDGGPEDVRKPVITEVAAEHLGIGHRVERAIRGPVTSEERLGPGPQEVIHYVFWVFRTRGTDVVVFAAHREPFILASMVDEIETFIDTISALPE